MSCDTCECKGCSECESWRCVAMVSSSRVGRRCTMKKSLGGNVCWAHGGPTMRTLEEHAAARAQEADAILKTLSERKPQTYVPEGVFCTLCGTPGWTWDQVRHDETCPWLRAVAYAKGSG